MRLRALSALALLATILAGSRGAAEEAPSSTAAPTQAESPLAPPAPSAQPPPTPPPCDVPAAERPPDPRCGESLDGRPLPEAVNRVGRVALAPPRVATHALLWPLVQSSALLERHRVLDWLHVVFTSDDELVGLRPVLSYATGFLPSLGARVFYRRLPHHLELSAHAETAGPDVVITRLHLRTLERMGIFVDAIWSRREDLLFAGNGPNTSAALADMGQGLARYGANSFEAAALWTHWLPARFFVRLHGDVLRRTYEDTSVHGGPAVRQFYGLSPAGCAALSLAVGCVNPAELPGFMAGERLVHGGAGLGVDLRGLGAEPTRWLSLVDAGFAPLRGVPRDDVGWSALVDASFAKGIAGDPSEHVTLFGETTASIGRFDHTFLVRGRAAVVEKLGDAPIPFDELITPAGASGMRGFPEGRFRGESGIVGTAEYRWYISQYIDASLFTDVGTVAGHNFEGLGSAHWFPSYGVGFRWYRTEGPYWAALPAGGFQVAYSVDYGIRLILALAAF